MCTNKVESVLKVDVEGGSGKRHVGFQALTMISFGAQLEFPLEPGGIQRAEYLTQGPKNTKGS
jgi:hypothetical protein